jgi:hypothetical protein
VMLLSRAPARKNCRGAVGLTGFFRDKRREFLDRNCPIGLDS